MSLHKTKAEMLLALPPLEPLGPYLACGQCGSTEGWRYNRTFARCRCGYVRAYTSEAAPTPEQIEAACRLVREQASAAGRCRREQRRPKAPPRSGNLCRRREEE